MKYYSLFYNASQTRINGGSGFGVRTVTEGTPRKIIDALTGRTVLYAYSSGSFKDETWKEHPEKISLYPKKFFFLRLEETDFYLIGRVVKAGYDYTYYNTNTKCRAGNFIVNMYAFEGWPGKEIFSLLQNDNASEFLHFLPLDYSPRFDNEEMRVLMVGPAVMLAPEEKPLAGLHSSVPKESIDLYFSFLEARSKNQAIMVRTKAADAEAVAAGFLSLLPEETAKQVSFILNYQEESIPEGFNVVFVNEYYTADIVPLSFVYVDFIENNRKASPIETVWRSNVESEVAAGGLGKVFSEWIYSPVASLASGLSKKINDILYVYCCHPGNFTLEMAKIEGFLDALADVVSKSASDSRLLNAKLVSAAENASDAKTLKSTVDCAEAFQEHGLLSEEAKNALKNKMSAIAGRSTKDLSELFYNMDTRIFDKYLSKSDFPPLENTVYECMTSNVGNLRDIVCYLEDSAEKRVRLFVKLADLHPDIIDYAKENLRKDTEAAAKVDYLSVFRNHYTESGFAELFFGQMKQQLQSDKPEVRKLIAKYKELVDVNPAFARMLFSDSSIFERLYLLYEPTSKEGESADIATIREDVLTVIPEDCKARKKWQLLLDVLECNTDGVDVLAYYSLALNLEAERALRKIAPLCFGKMAVDEVDGFLKSIEAVMKEEEIIEYAIKQKDNLKREYFAGISILYHYDFMRIESLATDFGLSSEDFTQFMKTRFPAMWRRQRIRNFFAGLLAPKKKDGKNKTRKQNKK